MCVQIIDKNGKVQPRTGRVGPEVEQKYRCTLSLDSTLDDAG